ncbi:hypothetical protein [Ottowia sp.]|uniref:hypothetical protein n=1 Tax=Ottowia sp. TaxID=1898956 RepID=UPI0025FB2F95|nr:hypothetical protein [Ottowia sp.]MBK6616293.1 hypothetical protein [Ottowia sp.]
MIKIVEELRRLAQLTGNCGRVIARFIAREMERNGTNLELAVKEAVTVVESTVEFAVFVLFCKEQAVEDRRFLESPELRLEVFPHLATRDVSMIVHIEPMPDSVTGRKRVLGDVATGVFEMMMNHRSLDSHDAIVAMTERRLGDIAFRRDDDSFRIFEDLVKGVYVEIEKCDRRLVALAAILNTQVARVVPEGFDLELGWYSPEDVDEMHEGLGAREEAVTA